MAYTKIPIPGVEYPGRLDVTGIRVDGGIDRDKTVTVSLNYRGMDYPVQLEFTVVLEYRFITSFVSYEDIDSHRGDFEFGLIEIHNSQYIENMAAKGMYRDFGIGNRFGKTLSDPLERAEEGGIEESDVRHLRFSLDDWGQLNVLCLGFRFTTPTPHEKASDPPTSNDNVGSGLS